MGKNIIQILKSGNQELFYSSFIAWLLDAGGEHGLSDRFRTWFLTRIGERPQSVTVETEKRLKKGRADIYLLTEGGRKIVIENKTKSLGSDEQIKTYEEDADRVVPLGFLPENFPEQRRAEVVTYADILGFLQNVERRAGTLSVLVDHFIAYLASALAPFDIMDRFCKGTLSLSRAKLELAERHQAGVTNDNDWRFFQAVYFYRLRTHIADNVPGLVLGSTDYYEPGHDTKKPDATKWIIEKNRQGPAYMEAIVYRPAVSGRLRIAKRWEEPYSAAANQDLSPRLELRVGPDDFLDQGKVGVFQLGCWDAALAEAFRSSGIFSRRGKRNFHQLALSVDDLKYSAMTNIMVEEMGKVWEFRR